MCYCRRTQFSLGNTTQILAPNRLCESMIKGAASGFVEQPVLLIIIVVTLGLFQPCLQAYFRFWDAIVNFPHCDHDNIRVQNMLHVYMLAYGKKRCLHTSLEVTPCDRFHHTPRNTIVYTTVVGWMGFLAWCIDNKYGMSVCRHTNDYSTQHRAIQDICPARPYDIKCSCS